MSGRDALPIPDSLSTPLLAPAPHVPASQPQPEAAMPSMWSPAALQTLVLLLLAQVLDATCAVLAGERRASLEWRHGMLDALALCATRALVHFLVVLLSVAYCAPRARQRTLEAGEAEHAMEKESKLPRLGANRLRDPKREWERQAHAATRRQNLLQNSTLSVAFALDTFTAVASAVKAVSFGYENEKPFLASVLCSAVVLANVEFFLLKKLVWALAEERGRLVPSLHNHELFYAPRMPGHWCDGCHSRIVGEAYRCKLCDFDACPSCFDKAWRDAGSGAAAEARPGGRVLTNRDYFFRALSYGRPHWRLLLASALALLLSSAATLALPSFTGRILDSVYAKDKSAFEDNVMRMVVASACISALSVIQDIGFFDAQMSGQLTSRLTNDVSGMVAPWSTIVNTCLSSSLTLAGGLAMCVYTSWKLSALAMASPILFLTSLYAKFSKSMNREIYAALGDANSAATEAMQNIRTVRAFSTEKGEIQRYRSAVNVALGKGVKDALASAGTSAATSMVDLGTSALILGFGGWTAINHPDELTAGDLLRFQLYWGMIDSSWRALNGVLNSLMVSAAAAQRVLSLMDAVRGLRAAGLTPWQLPEIDLEVGDKFDASRPPSIELERVSFRYPSRPESLVMNELSLRIDPGKVTALVGASGGGKSTIVALLMRMYDPREGRILVNNKDLRAFNLSSFHGSIGLVQQDTQLFATSVLENIAYGLPEDSFTAQDVVQAATSARIHEEILRMDDGYGTKIGERGVRLSGGQRQRIALARVFLRRPKLLLLDEATSALDAENEAHVQASIDTLLRESSSTATCVVIAHRLSTVVRAAKICVVQNGALVEEGDHHSLIRDPNGVYAKLVKTQMVAAAAAASVADAKPAEE